MIYGEVPLAILPAGTANVLSVELGLGTRIVRAAERLSELVPEKIAVGLLENSMERRHFLMMAGVGFDAMIVYNIDAALKQRMGRVASIGSQASASSAARFRNSMCVRTDTYRAAASLWRAGFETTAAISISREGPRSSATTSNWSLSRELTRFRTSNICSE